MFDIIVDGILAGVEVEEEIRVEDEFMAWVDAVDAEMENSDIWNFL